MGIEIDFLAVGDSSKSGDAIAVRFGNLHGKREEQTVITIDGGTKESGENLVEHIKTHFGTTYVDKAFLTHPDGDHASGMSVILENLRVGEVVMHRPWEHASIIHDLFDDDRTTPNSIKERSKENLLAAHEVEQIALAKSIKIVEPFAGMTSENGTIRILGPTEDYYREALAQFDFMPELADEKTRPLSSFSSVAKAAIRWVGEIWNKELLVDPEPDAVGPENNSSMIMLITVDEKHYLFTGDAGVLALSEALDYAATIPIDWSRLAFIQVPHHGSKRNLGPTVLNRLFGNIGSPESPTKWTAFISAARQGEPKHPNKRVINALRRRGGKVHKTAGVNILHPRNSPDRKGYSSMVPLPFYTQIEDDD